ncbi:MAG: disulfide bond formation protein B [Alphaproteobacteria bacterium]|nr:disulfide bond formation protein B [Alphaproteobacteria bacterium]
MESGPIPPRLAAFAVALGAAAVLGGALAFQHIGGLAPCVLCYWQRYPYWAAIPLAAAAALAAPRSPRAAALLLGLAAGFFVADAGIAAFHVGVEQHWWAGTAECGGTRPASGSLEELRARLLAAPIVRCDEPAWSLFGISMAGYNFLAALALAAFSAWGARGLAKGNT